MKKGFISVQSENIFPIIKQFLYSDREVFLRELVANAVDATTKLQTLARKGEIKEELGDLTIEVIVDRKKRTLTIRDRGVGMTREEVEKYLNQVAFSSAQEFLEKYKSEAQIIGHFGLGFYSAFMVADKVEVITRSWHPDAKAVIWTCEGNPEYMLDETDRRSARGTDVVLYLSKDASEFLEETRIQALLEKYCRFLPVPIKFGKRKETITEEGKDGKKKTRVVEVDNIINKPAIWRKPPAELKDEDYLTLYETLYPYSEHPLFWVHLNIDYPFNLMGILYFPRLGNALEIQRNKIQLYSNFMFVTNDVKEIVPEFLTLLHGVIDSPDIPLNVSRSYLQSDSNVRKIASYITRKVAERLNELFKKDRKDFEQKWDDLGIFIKYGMISEEKFYEKALKFALLKNTQGQYFTIDEYKEKVKSEQTNKDGKVVLLYTHDREAHHTYIDEAHQRNYDVLLMDMVVDNHFMQHLEHKMEDILFARVDADTLDHLIDKGEARDAVLSEAQQKEIEALFKEVTQEHKGATVVLKALSPEAMPVQITHPEFLRRMREMQMVSGMKPNGMPEFFNIVVNTNHPLIAKKLLAEQDAQRRQELARYVYHLALLQNGMLRGEALTQFVRESLKVVES